VQKLYNSAKLIHLQPERYRGKGH